MHVLRRRGGVRFGREPSSPERNSHDVTPGPADTYYVEPELRIGPVLSKAFEVLFGNFFTFILISAVATIPAAYYEWATVTGVHANFWLGVALRLVLTSLCEAMILYAAFQTLRGRPASPAVSVARGLRRFFPVLGASLLVSIVVGVGFVLLIIPGLIASIILSLTLPVCVVERLGPVESMSRSSELTRGYRWQIFGALFAVGLVELVVGAVIGATVRHPDTLAIYVVVTSVANVLFRAYQSVLTAIIYHDLRVIKDGLDLEGIAAVFD